MPKKLERCVRKVQQQGKDESSAYAICSSSTGWKKKKGGGWRKDKMKESVDKVHIRNFIGHLCNKEFAEANKSLEAAVREKTKNMINKYKENE